MGLAGPHVGMHAVFVQAVAIGLALGVQHDFAQLGGGQHMIGPAGDHFGLKQIPAEDIHDDLRRVGELLIQQGDLGLGVAFLNELVSPAWSR